VSGWTPMNVSPVKAGDSPETSYTFTALSFRIDT
jgi:hypothetical protein